MSRQPDHDDPGRAGDTSGHARPPRPDRREEVLAAAEELVATEGLGAVSVRAVAGRAGIGASTLRYWFPSQDALVTALARRRVDPQLDDRQITDTSVPATDRLTECLAQFLPATDAHVTALEQWAALLTTAVGPHATPLGRAFYAGGVRSAADRVRSWLAVLVEEGALDSHKATTATPLLLTRIDGLSLGLLPTGTVPDVATALDILRADVDGLLTPQPPTSPDTTAPSS